jgi:hypothetical protein
MDRDAVEVKEVTKKVIQDCKSIDQIFKNKGWDNYWVIVSLKYLENVLVDIDEFSKNEN